MEKAGVFINRTTSKGNSLKNAFLYKDKVAETEIDAGAAEVIEMIKNEVGDLEKTPERLVVILQRIIKKDAFVNQASHLLSDEYEMTDAKEAKGDAEDLYENEWKRIEDRFFAKIIWALEKEFPSFTREDFKMIRETLIPGVFERGAAQRAQTPSGKSEVVKVYSEGNARFKRKHEEAMKIFNEAPPHPALRPTEFIPLPQEKMAVISPFAEQLETLYQNGTVGSLTEALQVFATTAEGLEHLDERGLVLLDIVPANIGVRFSEEKKIKEGFLFDYDKMVKKGEKLKAGEVEGTLPYFIPELQTRMTETTVGSEQMVFQLGLSLFDTLFPSARQKERDNFDYRCTTPERLRNYFSEVMANYPGLKGVDKSKTNVIELLGYIQKLCSYSPNSRPAIADVVQDVRRFQEQLKNEV